jgi:hypothetical protein
MPSQRERARVQAATRIKSVEWSALGELRAIGGEARPDGTIDSDTLLDLCDLVDGIDRAWRALERMKLRRDAQAQR